MTIKKFDSVNNPLLKGINLIEASAGTGKTYAIAMLVLRFIVELDIPIDKLLVVTFTKAATEELKERIRKRLIEVSHALDQGSEIQDKTLADWLANLAIDPKEIKKRLRLALIDIDQAGIFTIHGFCQRVLKEHALESGQLFDSELTGNIAPMIQNCADDFWRIQVYQRSAQETAILTAVFKSPDALLSSIQPIQAAEKIFPEPENLGQQFQKIEVLIRKARQRYEVLASSINAAISEQKFKADYSSRFDTVSKQFLSWLNEETDNLPALDDMEMFTRAGVQQNLNGRKFLKNKNQSSEERKQDFLDGFETQAFDDLVTTIQNITLIFRRMLLTYIQENLEQQLHKLNIMSYDQLISRFSEALEGDKGQLLCAELQHRFKAALIDEFQDTDKLQWQIFSNLFDHPEHYLYLIGDPKQAIYKFRGADIFSYFAAQKQAQHHFTLDKNWRSHPSLVLAVNTVFALKDKAFVFDQFDYHQVSAAQNEADGFLNKNGQSLPSLVLWQLPESKTKTGFWNKGNAENELQIATVNEVLQLLEGSVKLSINGDNSAIQPADIAILVRSNQQARDYQNCLLAAGVPAVLNSTESVFETLEAQDLYVLLLAIAHPGNQDLLRQALTLDWFGMNGQQFYTTLNDESLFDVWLSRFQNYFLKWQGQGLMVLMDELLKQEAIPQQIAKTRMAERQLTNLYHLTELLQQSAIDEHLGVIKTLDWLASAINDHNQAEEQQLRLESDDEAVKIITMHRAKGLEYPIVFCPSLWQRSARLAKQKHLVRCHKEGQVLVDLGSENFEQHRQQALIEELAEDMRLLYVAITRAKYRCYVAWADVRTEKQANHSALCYLLFAEQQQDWQQKLLSNDFVSQQDILQSLSQKIPEAIQYRLLEAPAELAGYYQANAKQQRLSARQRTRPLITSWQMSSYTALSALSHQDIPEIPTDKAQEQELSDQQELLLPKGAHTGNVIHELLQIFSFKALADGAEIDQQRDRICLRYGLHCEQPKVIDDLLQQTVQTPLTEDDPLFILANIKDEDCLKEMPFYVSINSANAARINDVLGNSPAYQPLSEKKLSGFLTGFIDLVCEYQNRFYVMDYKTNWLPDYQPETMTAAMKEHNYGLQYWLYSLVLHRYLQNRMPDYDFQQHFGGVRYLFVRGMEKAKPMSGVYEDYPDLERLEQLGKLFSFTRQAA